MNNDWSMQKCGNLDSCEEHTEHEFPNPGAMVRVNDSPELRIVGSDKYIRVTPGDYVVSDEVIHEAHQVGIIIPTFVHMLEENKTIPRDTVVWVDIEDDIKPLVHTFLYRRLLDGKPVEELRASAWRMHVVTDRHERDEIVEYYRTMFKNESNKTWEIIPTNLPA